MHSLSLAVRTSLAVRQLPDAVGWLRGSGLEIVLLVTGAILFTRFATWLGGRIIDQIDANAAESDVLVRSEAAKHRHAVAQVVIWTVLVATYCVTAVMIVERLGVPVTGLVAPAAVAGVALGFGAQRIVADLLAGFFIITERQYGFGDVVRIAVPGAPEPLIGTVEEVTLRITRIRAVNGEVQITPNGQIVQVTNLSRDWARSVVDVPVPSGVELHRVTEILHAVGEQAYQDPAIRPMLLDTPTVMGVENLDVDRYVIRLVARTLPGRQFEIGRILRGRAGAALAREGIHVPAGLDTAEPSGTS
jgi:small-conductance mechanosensitive channel